MKRKNWLFLGLLIALAWVGPDIPLNASALPGQQFELHKIGDGFLRIDKKTGATSFCSRDKIKWACKKIENTDTYKANISPLHYRHKASELSQGHALDQVRDAFREMMRRFTKFTNQIRP